MTDNDYDGVYEPSEEFLTKFLFPWIDEFARALDMDSEEITEHVLLWMRRPVLDEYEAWIAKSWEQVGMVSPLGPGIYRLPR